MLGKISNLGVRAKLSLSAIAVITVLYTLLGATVYFIARQAILGSIDSNLKKMAQDFDRPHGPPPGDRGPGGPGDHGPGDHGPDDRGPGGRGGFDPGRFDPGRFDRRPDDRGPGPGSPNSADPNGRREFRPDFRGRGNEPGQANPNVVVASTVKKSTKAQKPPVPAAPPIERPRIETPDLHDNRPRSVWQDDQGWHRFHKTISMNPKAVTEARLGKTTLAVVTFNDEPVEVITAPVHDPFDHHVGEVMEASYWLGDIYKVLRTLAETLFLILPLGIILMGWASAFVVGKTLQPVRDMRSAAAKIEAENLSGRLNVVGNDEFAELAETMNGMFQRLDVSFKSQAETLERLRTVILQQRQFTADASHELKTPLAVIKVNASLLKPSLAKDPDSLESIDSIDHAVNRMSKLVQDLLLLARTDAGQLNEQFAEVDFNEVVERSLSLVGCPSKLQINLSEKPCLLEGSKFALERLVTNLLDNACRHTESDGRVELTLSSSGGWIKMAIADNGEGIPEEHLDKIFERFHRVDSSRQSDSGGSGLGLAICKGIVDAHGGRIAVESKLDVGTTFTIFLPAAKSS